MSFSDPDPLEQDMGVLCTDMSPEQLVTYIHDYHAAFDLELPVEGIKERSVMRGLQNTYGPARAGNIVKWAFYHHKGRFRGAAVGYFDFIKARKWFTDQLALEYQDALRKERPVTASRVAVGSRKLSEL